MAIYIIKRKSYSAVRNPYLERRMEAADKMAAEDQLTDQSDDVPTKSDTPEFSKQVKKMKESPVYQNLDKDKKSDKVNKILSKDNRNKLKTQNININKTTNINNPSKEKTAEIDAQVKMAKMRQQSAEGGGVNSKLIEIQKTNPLKPLSMNGGN